MFAIGIVSELAIVFCKLFIVFAIGTASFFALDAIYGGIISSVLGTAIFISILSWFVGNMFMEVLGIGITTILQCFIADQEVRPSLEFSFQHRYHPSRLFTFLLSQMHPDGSYFVPDELSDFLRKHAQC